MKQEHVNYNDFVCPAPIAEGGEASTSPSRPNVRQLQVVTDSRPVEAQPGSSALRRLGYSQQEMLEILPLSERKLFSMRQRGEIPFVKVGDRVLYPVDDIHAWWDKLKRRGVN